MRLATKPTRTSWTFLNALSKRTESGTGDFVSNMRNTCDGGHTSVWQKRCDRIHAALSLRRRWAMGLERIGPDRAKGTYAFRSLLDSGCVLAFGSDWNVAPLDPIQGIAALLRDARLMEKIGWLGSRTKDYYRGSNSSLYRRLRLRGVCRSTER